MTDHNGVTPPQRGREHERLGMFVGRWRVEGSGYGRSARSAVDPEAAAPWTGTESFAWVPGRFFLLHRWDATIGAAPFQGLAVIGYDPEAACYVSRSHDNHGYYREYVARVGGAVWTFLGGAERARVAFSADGDSQTIHWDWSPDGGQTWLPLSDRTAVRLPVDGH